MATPTKVARTNPYIGTHDMTFHCDDVTACTMLKKLDRFKDHDIVRTRDQEILDKAEIVVDVGGVLDVEKLRLDHHQRTFNQTIKDYHPKLRTTNPDKPPRLSSAGLVYSIFGKEYIMKVLDINGKYEELDEEERRKIDAIFERAYVEFMEEIDAIDNGVEVASGDNLVFNYHVCTGISSRVGRYNPTNDKATPEQRLEQFKKAMELVSSEITEGIHYLANEWWPVRQQFRDFVLKRKEFDPSGQLVLIDSTHMSGWKSALQELETEMGIEGELKFIIYNTASDASKWRLTAVPIDIKSFLCRAPLKEEWRGLRDEDLQKVSGIPDATFVHYSGFTGGAQTLEGVKSLARRTLGIE